jgi:hypothetical protein
MTLSGLPPANLKPIILTTQRHPVLEQSMLFSGRQTLANDEVTFSGNGRKPHQAWHKERSSVLAAYKRNQRHTTTGTAKTHTTPTSHAAIISETSISDKIEKLTANLARLKREIPETDNENKKASLNNQFLEIKDELERLKPLLRDTKIKRMTTNLVKLGREMRATKNEQLGASLYTQYQNTKNELERLQSESNEKKIREDITALQKKMCEVYPKKSDKAPDEQLGTALYAQYISKINELANVKDEQRDLAHKLQTREHTSPPLLHEKPTQIQNQEARVTSLETNLNNTAKTNRHRKVQLTQELMSAQLKLTQLKRAERQQKPS